MSAQRGVGLVSLMIAGGLAGWLGFGRWSARATPLPGPHDTPPPPLPSHTAQPTPLSLVEALRADRRYRTPSPADRDALRACLHAVLRAALAAPNAEALPPEDSTALASAAGFVLQAQPGGWWSLVEVTPAGGGVYGVRPGPLPTARPWVVQAPHSFYDLDTEALASSLFLAGDLRAVFLASTHRYRALEGETPTSPAHPGDAAHAPDGWFQAATEGALAALRDGVILQLHGMEERDAGDVIVSSGAAARPPEWGLWVGRLQTAFAPAKVLRYPEDVSTLGGTTNVQGRYLASAAPNAAFLHLEMSRAVRLRLTQDPALLASVRAALLTGASP